MSEIHYVDELAVSPRVTLRRGDGFKVTGGPRWVTVRNGKRYFEPIGERGTFTFDRVAAQGRRRWIEAYRHGGGHVVLMLTSWKSPVPGIVPRPYRVTRRLVTK